MKTVGLHEATYQKLFDIQTNVREALNKSVSYSEIITDFFDKELWRNLH